MSTTPTWKIGDKVRAHPGHWRALPPEGTYTITGVPGPRSKTYTATPDNQGTGAIRLGNLVGSARSFLPVDAPDPTMPLVYPGTIARVEIKGVERIVVVIRAQGDTCSVTLPGGNGGRYWRGVRIWDLDVIEPDDLTLTA